MRQWTISVISHLKISSESNEISNEILYLGVINVFNLFSRKSAFRFISLFFNFLFLCNINTWQTGQIVHKIIKNRIVKIEQKSAFSITMYGSIFHQNGNAPALNVQIPNYPTHFFTLKIQSQTRLKMKTISNFWEQSLLRIRDCSY